VDPGPVVDACASSEDGASGNRPQPSDREKSKGGAIGTVGSTVAERRRWKDRTPLGTSTRVVVLCLNPNAANPDICGTEFQETQDNGVVIGGHPTR